MSSNIKWDITRIVASAFSYQFFALPSALSCPSNDDGVSKRVSAYFKETKPSDRCDDIWISINIGLHYRYAGIRPCSDSGEWDCASASQAFYKISSIISASVIFTEFCTLLSFFFWKSLPIKAVSKNIKLYLERFHYVRFIRNLLFWLTIVKHQL